MWQMPTSATVKAAAPTADTGKRSVYARQSKAAGHECNDPNRKMCPNAESSFFYIGAKKSLGIKK